MTFMTLWNRSAWRLGSGLVLSLGTALLAPAAHAQTYLWLEGVSGEATEQAHTRWIDVTSFSDGIESNLSLGSANSGVGVGKAKFQKFEIEKPLDRTTPTLLKACAQGRIYKRAIVEVCKNTGRGIQCVYRITLGTVVVASSSVEGKSGAAPVQHVTLAYGAATWEYMPTAPVPNLPPPPAGGNSVKEGWDQIKNNNIDSIGQAPNKAPLPNQIAAAPPRRRKP